MLLSIVEALVEHSALLYDEFLDRAANYFVEYGVPTKAGAEYAFIRGTSILARERVIYQPTSPITSEASQVNAGPILSFFRSFTTMYLPAPIHPHRNHFIWLICALTIAFRALQ